MDLSELERMTLKDLQDLRGRIDVAIRAAIARGRVERDVKPAAATMDLEREREVWEARKKANENVYNIAMISPRSE